MPIDPHRVQAIFLALAEQPPAERSAYLIQECGENQDLRDRVEALLRAHDQTDSFLNITSPNGESTEIRSLSEQPGDVIGPYKLLQQIGEGGMGVVYMAEQTQPVERRVALKIIKPGMDTQQVIARFEAERQALAMMDHPNIAKVLDAGTTATGRPYFVMELVKGLPVTQYCDEQQLSPRERLELFIPICQAVQHAHQKGIIHRDLKPSNILIARYDDKPVPKVIDFGVAKATSQKLTERTMFTQYGQLVGTIDYMSPEQAQFNQLDVDTRSDIYSLGVLLYELLTGETPFDRTRLRTAAFEEVLRIIREEEPPRPSVRLSSCETLASVAANRQMEPHKLGTLVRGELDWIVMKALEKDRSRRYETANSFALDVKRYLDDEPVLACPPSAAYRFGKLARRNKSAMVVASLILFFVTLLGSGAGWAVRDRAAREGAARHERQTREAEVAQEKATRQTLINERVTLALEEARKRHQEGRWWEALNAAKRAEALAATGEPDEETHQRVREVLADMQMLATVEEVRVNSTKNDAGYDLMVEDRGNARAFREFGIDIDALERGEAARRIRARAIRQQLAVFLDSWSHVRRRLEIRGSKPTGKDWRELLEVARAADPDPWRDQFRKAVLSDDRQRLVELAASAPISSLPAETVDRLGDALIDRGAFEEAAAFLKKGQRRHPQDYWINVNLGICFNRMNPPQRDEAIRYYTAAVALRPDWRHSLTNLGHAFANNGKLDEAIECFGQAIELKPDDASSWYVRGDAHARFHQWDQALNDYTKATELDPREPAYWDTRGSLYAQLDRWEEAAADFEQAATLKPKSLLYSYQLALLQLQHGDRAGYRKTCSRMLEHFDPSALNAAYMNVCTCVLAPNAVDDWTTPLDLAERAHGELGIKYETLTLRGAVLYRAGRYKEAAQRLSEAEAIFKPRVRGASAYNALFQAMASFRLGHTAEAAIWLERAVKDLETAPELTAAIWNRLLFQLLRREAEELLAEKNK